ncbi:MAG: hypothetical protein KBE09_05010 [Candidatus Pacebacteria bacterium]|nr:hypothetical protein [Candidatus Paceibacterota bacterium]
MQPEPTAALYTISGATGEIFIMLLVSFVLGALLGRLLAAEQTPTERRLSVRTPQLPTPTIIPMPAPTVKKDDLKIVEGIGPRIEEVLNQHGIYTWAMLAKTPVDRLARILESGSGHFKMHDPKTWPDQAALAATHRWDELKAFQDILVAGKDH